MREGARGGPREALCCRPHPEPARPPMTDAELISTLHSLGLNDENVHAIALLPLLEVAWADGRIHEPERRLILEIARKRGVLDSEAALLLETWLRYRPSDRYMALGRTALAELARRGHSDVGITPGTIHEVLQFCEQVAVAASGLLGRAFKTVDPAEKAALAEIAEALSAARKPSWSSMQEDLQAAREALLDEDDESTAFEDADPREVAARRSAARPSRPPNIRRISRGRGGDDRPPPAVLVQLKNGREAAIHRVPERGLSIGRRNDNDVVILDDPQVSRQHCRVFRQGPRLYVVDCASAGGTYVNDERVHERRLLGDEEIRVGQTSFLFTLGVLRD